MVKCPNCGAIADLDNFETEYIDDGEKIDVIRWYRCKCGHGFTTASLYQLYGIEDIEDECI